MKTENESALSIPESNAIASHEYRPGRFFNTKADPRYDRISRIGTLHVGEKDANGIPRSLDYFKASGKYADRFHKEYGEKPQCISIVFPSDNIVDVCNARYECWGTGDKSNPKDPNKGRKIAYGDGETFFVYSAEEDAYVSHEGSKDEMRRLPGKWRQLVTLRFLLVKVPVLGYWELTTGGANTSIPNLVGVFDRVYEQVGRRIIKVPFDLTVEFTTSKRPGKQSRYPILNLIPMLGQEEVTAVKRMHESLLESVGILTSDVVLQLTHEGEQNGNH